MYEADRNLNNAAALFKSKTKFYALGGPLIAFGFACLATLLDSYLNQGSINPSSWGTVQANNPALWLLDLLPLILFLWGQYSATDFAYRASAIFTLKTQDLKNELFALRSQLEHTSERIIKPSRPYEDQLPGLSTQEWLNRANKAISTANGNGTVQAIASIDFDHFKTEQMVLNEKERDELNHKIASRLIGVMRDKDSLMHLGDDEFAMLLPDLSNPRESESLAEQYKTMLDEPLTLDAGKEITQEVCIGISLAPEHGTQAESLLAKSRVAKERARVTTNAITTYEPWPE